MASIAIARNGKIIYQRSTGAAKISGHDTTAAGEHTEYPASC
jgi:hypothetical protein